MPFDPETVYVLLEGSAVLPISGVTDNYSTADVEIYDGETYRDQIDAGFMGTARSLVVDGGGSTSWIIPNGSTENETSSTFSYDTVCDPHLEQSDSFTHTAPRFLQKTRTLWSFPRASMFTHVVWADIVQGTSPLPPYRLGQPPTPIPTA